MVRNGRFPFGSDFLSVLACSTSQMSGGGELKVSLYQHLLISPTLYYLSWPVSLIKSWKTAVFRQDLWVSWTEWLNILTFNYALKVKRWLVFILGPHEKINQKRFLFLM